MNPLFHILVVNDEPAIGDLIGTYLSQEGYRVSTAEGGEAMRRILEAEPVDLVIFDTSVARGRRLFAHPLSSGTFRRRYHHPDR